MISTPIHKVRPRAGQGLISLSSLFLLVVLISCAGGSAGGGGAPGDNSANLPVLPTAPTEHAAGPNLDAGWPSPDGGPDEGDAWVLEVQSYAVNPGQTLSLSATVRCVWHSKMTAPANPCQEGRIVRLVNWKSNTYVENPLHNTGADTGSVQVDFLASDQAVDFFSQQTQNNALSRPFILLRRDSSYQPQPLAQEHDCANFAECGSPKFWIPGGIELTKSFHLDSIPVLHSL